MNTNKPFDINDPEQTNLYLLYGSSRHNYTSLIHPDGTICYWRETEGTIKIQDKSLEIVNNENLLRKE